MLAKKIDFSRCIGKASHETRRAPQRQCITVVTPVATKVQIRPTETYLCRLRRAEVRLSRTDDDGCGGGRTAFGEREKTVDARRLSERLCSPHRRTAVLYEGASRRP